MDSGMTAAGRQEMSADGRVGPGEGGKPGRGLDGKWEGQRGWGGQRGVA